MKYRLKNELPHDSKNYVLDILRTRGIEDVEAFINPTEANEISPYLLDNIEDGVELLLRHLESNSKILMIVDSDADGMTSFSILWLYIKKHFPNANLNYYLHTGKQHGLDDCVDDILNSDYNLIILPDSSSNDFKEHKQLKDTGKDILVLDHHEAEHYSEDALVINNQLSKNYKNKQLCGAGIVYKFCQVFDKVKGTDFANEYIDLVALGLISDVMNQGSQETRYYIIKGLQNIKNKGFKTLIEKQSYSLKDTENLTPIGIAFYVTPLINSIIRVGTSEEKEALLLCFIDPDRELESTKRGAIAGETETAAEMAARVATNTRNRQNKIKEEAVELLDTRIHKYGLLENKILIIEVYEEDGIPNELTGLISSVFVNRYSRPVLLVRRNDEGFLRGSGRGNNNFELSDLKAFLEESQLMDYVAGRIVALNTFSAYQRGAFFKCANEEALITLVVMGNLVGKIIL